MDRQLFPAGRQFRQRDVERRQRRNRQQSEQHVQLPRLRFRFDGHREGPRPARSGPTAHPLYVGNSGSGTLNILSNGTVSNTIGEIGYASGSVGTVTVTGAGSTWTNSSVLYVGDSGSGTLSVTNGGTVSCAAAEIGHGSGSTGGVTIDGSASKWTIASALYVGDSGSGTLNISGGAVTVGGPTYVARSPGSTGAIVFGAGGGTLTANSLLAGPSQLTGTGTIIVHGIVSDVDLAFDATHGLSQSLSLNNITVSLSQSTSGYLGARLSRRRIADDSRREKCFGPGRLRGLQERFERQRCRVGHGLELDQ